MDNDCLCQRHRLFWARSGLWVRSGVLLAALAAASPALAVTFYSADASYCNGNSYSCSYDRFINQATPQAASVGYYAGAATYSGLGGTAVANVAFDPGAPTLVPQGTYSASATASIFYNVQIVGAPGVYVPVHIGADITAGAIHATDVQGNNYKLVDNPALVGPDDGIAEPSNYEIDSDAKIKIFQSSTNVGIDGLEVRSLMFGDRNTAMNALGQAILIDQTYFFLSDTDITVQLTASASLSYSTIYGVSGNQYGNVSASADPTFTIDDPAFSGFSIVGVPYGAGPPASAVPEPATWAMMLIGFGAVRIGGRRRMANRVHCTFRSTK